MIILIDSIILGNENNMNEHNTAQSKLDLVTHPVRLRILLLLAGAQQTAGTIVAALNDVPASSVYRHLSILQEAGLIEVVAERRVRGAVEKTLRVAPGAAHLGGEELAQMRPDDHRRSFLIFFAQLFHEFDRYVQQPDIDFVRDMVGYRTGVFYATDDEWRAAISAINAVLLPLLNQPAGAGRTLRRLATITMPADDHRKDDRS